MERTDFSVVVVLTVKAGDPADAKRIAEQRLLPDVSAWFQEDLGKDAPYPDGSLLFYGFEVK